MKNAIARLSDQYLQIWVVFDKDNFKCFDEAIQLADMYKKIKVAFSNQAFDLWFLLHYERYEGYFHRDKYIPEINRLMERTQRNKLLKPFDNIYPLLEDRMDVAIMNGKLGHQKHKRDNADLPESCWESCTTVYKLVEELSRIQD